MAELYTLSEAIRDNLFEEGRSTLHKFEAYLPFGVRAVRDLNISVGGTPKTVMLTPTSYNTIAAPPDMFSWSKLGVCIGGLVYNLAQNKDMCFPHMRNDCGELQPEPYAPYEGQLGQYLANAGLDVGWVYWAYTSYNEFGEFTGRLYGQGSGFSQIGLFNYNEELKEFVLTPNLANMQIVLEYIPDAINNANIIVPQAAIECVISFINWKKSRGPERSQYEREYKNAVIDYRRNKYSFNEIDFMNAVRAGYRLSPKG